MRVGELHPVDRLTLTARYAWHQHITSDGSEPVDEAAAGAARLWSQASGPRGGLARLLAAPADDPGNPRHHHLLALTLSDRHPAAARDHFLRALHVNPHDADCRADFGRFRLSRGEADEGLGELRRAGRAGAENPALQHKIIRILLAHGFTGAARDHVRRAVRRHPGDERLRTLRRRVMLRLLRDRQATAAAACRAAARPGRRCQVIPFPAPGVKLAG